MLMSISFCTFATAQQVTQDSINVVTSATVDNFQETDQVLAKILNRSLEVAEKTGNFLIEQAPDVLKEFYAWHTAEAIFTILIGILIFVLGRNIPRLWMVKGKPADRWETQFFNLKGREEEGVAAWIIFASLAIASLVTTLIGLHDLIYILVSPKLYLIDYLMSLR